LALEREIPWTWKEECLGLRERTIHRPPKWNSWASERGKPTNFWNEKLGPPKEEISGPWKEEYLGLGKRNTLALEREIPGTRKEE